MTTENEVGNGKKVGKIQRKTQAKEHRWPPEARKVKETGCSLEPPDGTKPANNFTEAH